MSNFASASRRTLSGRRGVAALEFAVLGGVFCIMLLAAVDIGRYYMVTQGVRNFMADAQRYGFVNMTSGQNLTCAQLVSAMGRGGAVGGLVSSSVGTAGSGNAAGTCVTRTDTPVGGGGTSVTVTVEVDATFNFVINSFGILSPRLRDITTATYLL